MARVARIHGSHGFFVAVLGEPGRTYTHYVSIDAFPVRKHKIHNAKLEKLLRPLQLRGKPYPVKRAANQMLRVGREQGITKGARALLLEARSCATS